jgi:hypothetical protein
VEGALLVISIKATSCYGSLSIEIFPNTLLLTARATKAQFFEKSFAISCSKEEDF